MLDDAVAECLSHVKTDCPLKNAETFANGRNPHGLKCNYYPHVNRFTSSLDTTFAEINLKSTDVIIVDDFHATHSSWCTLHTTSSAGRSFHQIFLSLGLHQINSSRTHLDSTGRTTPLLDLVLVSQTQPIPSATTLPPIANCDYLPVLCKIDKSLKQLNSSRTRRIWCYNKADPRKLSLELRKSNWRPVSKAENVDAAWEAWKNILLSRLQTCAAETN